MKLRKAFRAIFLAVLLANILPQHAMAGTTTADFLKWGSGKQKSFFQVSISMATVIASQIKPKTAACLDDWYWANNTLQEKRNAEMLKQMEAYSKYHPNAVILAFLERACGKL